MEYLYYQQKKNQMKPKNNKKYSNLTPAQIAKLKRALSKGLPTEFEKKVKDKKARQNKIKLAKSQQMKIREKKLQSLFEEEVEKRELLYDDMVDEFEQNKIYKRLEKKILGRNK